MLNICRLRERVGEICIQDILVLFMEQFYIYLDFEEYLYYLVFELKNFLKSFVDKMY